MDTNETPAQPAEVNKKPIMPHNQGTAAKSTGAEDRVCWRSGDGLVAIKQLVRKTQRHPPSDYPVVVLHAFPRQHERIRRWGDGLELALTGEEIEQLIAAFNEASISQGAGELYRVLQKTPPKTQARKVRWRRFNQRRLWFRTTRA